MEAKNYSETKLYTDVEIKKLRSTKLGHLTMQNCSMIGIVAKPKKKRNLVKEKVTPTKATKK